MAQETEIKATFGDGMRCEVQTQSGHQLILDANEQVGGKNAGPQPMELLLSALAGCAGMDILSILRKMRQDVTDYQVIVHGTKAEMHPKIYTHITVEHRLTGHNIEEAAVQRALTLTEEIYCGVSATLEKTATIQHTIVILETQ